MAAWDGQHANGDCAAHNIWNDACQALGVNASDAGWDSIAKSSPSDQIWHSLRNCVAYQAEIWQSLLAKGMQNVREPGAFKMALVLRHTPSDVTANLLHDLLKGHEQEQQLTSYILALLNEESSLGDDPSPTPLRDLQLFGDCELAVLAAGWELYQSQAKLIRAEYAKLPNEQYVELRIKVLNQLLQIPKLYHSPEFESLEGAAKSNIQREINTLREQIKK